jgi:glycosyltransferase involved in cell wall biosynthesis
VTVRICVAISVRDGEAFLAEAIESVLGQTHTDVELRIYDNLSSDASAAIIGRYLADPRVSFTVNDFDLGYYGSLNRALAETSAPLFVPFAADDVMEPENLAAKLAVIERTGAGFAHSPVLLIDPAGAVIGDLGRIAEPVECFAAPEFFRLCAPVNCVTCPSTLIRTDALRALGGFDGRVPYCADWLAWMRLSLRHPVGMVHAPLVRWRQHPDSGTSDSLKSAAYARDDPASLALALADDAFPAAWDRLRAPMLAACLARTAAHLERDGHRRVAAGHAAYELALRAIMLAPGDESLRSLLIELARRAQLQPPRVPIHAVASPAPEREQIAAAVASARAIDRAQLLGTFAVTVAPDLVDRVLPLLEQVLADGPDVGIDLVPAASPEALLLPGVLALAPFASPEAARAEAAGVPVLAGLSPDPFARDADPARWETLPIAG